MAGSPLPMMVAGKHMKNEFPPLAVRASGNPALTSTETPGGANSVVVKLPSWAAVVYEEWPLLSVTNTTRLPAGTAPGAPVTVESPDCSRGEIEISDARGGTSGTQLYAASAVEQSASGKIAARKGFLMRQVLFR